MSIYQTKYIKYALRLAESAALRGDVPIGALLLNFKSGKIIASASNSIEHTNNPSAHAELITIQIASNILKSKYLGDHDMYVTLEPCPMCSHAIFLSKIRRIYFGAFSYKMQDQLTDFCHIENYSQLKIEKYGGILEEECSIMLKNFFKKRR